MKKPVLYKLSDLPQGVRVEMPHYSTGNLAHHRGSVDFSFESSPVSIDTYRTAFLQIIEGINYGNSYLTNLTFAHELNHLEFDLEDVFHHAEAPYKLLYQDQFIVFSPEPFVHIKDGVISTYPMKGTRKSQSLMDGKHLLDDSKEQAEHATIVDLLRNDLSIVAHSVNVEDYRYLQIIKSREQELFQTSSRIAGTIKPKYQSSYGSIFEAILPAGSVSGAPKAKTVEMIKDAEPEPRGYYCGVFGVFDGSELQSAVMIRFIERQGDRYFYRSGGGLTSKSVLEDEYHELIHKIYVPIS